jgi:hypothetical protein
MDQSVRHHCVNGIMRHGRRAELLYLIGYQCSARGLLGINCVFPGQFSPSHGFPLQILDSVWSTWYLCPAEAKAARASRACCSPQCVL